MNPLLQFESVGKSFLGVEVLKAVSFEVGPGRVVGLVGENGAGKSTLMNLLGGNLRPDAGSMRFQGAVYAPRHPRDARLAGIGFVHQELNLFPDLDLAENLFLADFPTRGPLIRRRELHGRAAALLQRVGLGLPPTTPVGRLSTGERQLLEVARALSFDARLLILDEPTTSLSVPERERLFALVRQLRAEGRSLIYISHTLGEVLALADDVVVLRDGAVVGQGAAAEFDPGRLVSLMVGRELKQLFPKRSTPLQRADEGPLLEVLNLGQPGVVQNISFTLRHGEVLGLSGLMGAGRTELARILFGLDPHATGTIMLAGKSLTGPPRERIRQGLAFLTESRRDDGLCLEASVTDNIALVTLTGHARSPLRLLSFAGLREALAKVRAAVRLQPRLTDQQPVQTLSGGNQQKVVLAKWLLAEPRVLLLDEPTRGIDVGAKAEIYQLIHELADRGAGVLVISSELEELTGLCDRLLVLNRGRITGEFGRDAFDSAAILRAALPT
jgi:ribose transport system ATP-binding protein